MTRGSEEVAGLLMLQNVPRRFQLWALSHRQATGRRHPLQLRTQAAGSHPQGTPKLFIPCKKSALRSCRLYGVSCRVAGLATRFCQVLRQQQCSALLGTRMLVQMP